MSMGLPVRPPDDTECRALTRYVTRGSATPYILEQYRRGHASMAPPSGLPPRFDRILLRWGRSRWTIGFADAYSRWFAPMSSVQRKLTLILAIVEHCPPYHEAVTAATSGARVRIVAQLVGHGIRFGVAALLGLVLLGPLHLGTLLTRRRA